MADPRSLMRPLGSDHLKPRPYAQAVWQPPVPPPAPAQPGPQPVEAAPEPLPPEPEMPVQEPEVIPQPEETYDPLPVAEADFAPLMEEAVCPAEVPPIPQEPPAPEALPEEEPFDLDAVIASILADDPEDDEEFAQAQDALPTETMPEPATVPLLEELPPRPRKHGWIVLVGAAVLAAAAGYAARRFGWLP